MKRFLFLFSVAMAVFAAPVLAADVGVSANVGEPGFYGHIELGNVPQPPLLIYPEPVRSRPTQLGAHSPYCCPSRLLSPMR